MPVLAEVPCRPGAPLTLPPRRAKAAMRVFRKHPPYWWTKPYAPGIRETRERGLPARVKKFVPIAVAPPNPPTSFGREHRGVGQLRRAVQSEAGEPRRHWQVHALTLESSALSLSLGGTVCRTAADSSHLFRKQPARRSCTYARLAETPEPRALRTKARTHRSRALCIPEEQQVASLRTGDRNTQKSGTTSMRFHP